MKLLLLLVVVLVLGAVVVLALSKRGKTKTTPEELLTNEIENKEIPTACEPLTKHEQAMFFRLQEALPNLIVLSQVSFSALLKAKSRATRNTFDRKRADFVICDKSFRVVAVIELDDSSHEGREKEDADRDVLLTQAGYRVLRYRGIPATERLQADFA